MVQVDETVVASLPASAAAVFFDANDGGDDFAVPPVEADGRRVTWSSDNVVHLFAPSTTGGAPSSVGELGSPTRTSGSSGGHGNGSSGAGSSGGGWWRAFTRRVAALKRELLALHLAVHDERCGWAARVLPLVVIAYALSPIDLIPDFIPVLGLLDDLLLVPFGIWLSLKLVPAEVMADARARAAAEPLLLSRSWVVGGLIALLWTAGLLAGAHYLIRAYGDARLRKREYAALAAVAGASAVCFSVAIIAASRHERRRQERWRNALLAGDRAAAAALAAQNSSSDEGEDDGSSSDGSLDQPRHHEPPV